MSLIFSPHNVGGEHSPPKDFVKPLFRTQFLGSMTGQVVEVIWNPLTGVVSFGGAPVITVPTLDEMDAVDDASASPLVLYRVGSNVSLYWFDPVPSQFVTASLGTGVDLTISQETYSDLQTRRIVATYRRGGDVFYRLSSERFTVERQATLAPVSVFTGAYPSKTNRLLFTGRPLLTEYPRDSSMAGQAIVT